MPHLIVIPDDYQGATTHLACIKAHSGLKVVSVGDLTRTPNAASLLAEAEGLVLIRERTEVNAAFLAGLPRLKLISQTGKIAGHIDLPACTAAGVAVVEGTGSPVAPAELTWLLIMAARRQFVPAVNGMKAGQWQSNIGRAVAGQTLGILGFGKIGQRVARYAAAFDMKLQVWGTPRAQAAAREAGLFVPESREAFFTTSDIITLHQRLVADNKGNVTLTDLLMMKPDALLVNTSRAALIEPNALLTALRQGRPGYAALDVYDDEPVYDTQHPLLALPNVLCSPHLGYVEQGGYDLYFKTALENAARFFAGDTTHVLNPDALIPRV